MAKYITLDNLATFLSKLKENGLGGGITDIKYDDLVKLRDEGSLSASKKYRITDYVTTTKQTNTSSVGHQFDIVVTALTENKLSEDATVSLHGVSGDDSFEYFKNCDLNAWEIKYCLDNNTDRFAWADTENGKGVIYYMKDEKGNECPYDFKNILFEQFEEGVSTNKFYFTFSYEVDSVIYDGTAHNEAKNCYDNIIKSYTESNKQILNNIKFINTSFGCDCYNNSFGYNCHDNSFGDACYRNSFGDACYNNSFGDVCYRNSFGNTCCGNSFGNSYQYNSFENSCDGNSFGDDCSGNSFGNSCDGNSFGDDCSDNSFGDDCSDNSFGNGYTDNSFGNICWDNSFGDYCQNNSFGNSCSNNSFGDNYSNQSYEIYVSSITNNDLAVPTTVGGIQAGTKLEDLNRQSISKLFDDLLFPTIYPTLDEPTCSIKYNGNKILKYGTDAPKGVNFILQYTPSKIYLNGVEQNVYSGKLDATNSYVYINDDITKIDLPTTVPYGDTVYRYYAAYSAGEAIPKTNKGDTTDEEGRQYEKCPAGFVTSSSYVTINGTEPYQTMKPDCSDWATEKMNKCTVNGEIGTIAMTNNVTLPSTETMANNNKIYLFKMPSNCTITEVKYIDKFSTTGYSDLLNLLEKDTIDGYNYYKYADSTMKKGEIQIYSGKIQVSIS